MTRQEDNPNVQPDETRDAAPAGAIGPITPRERIASVDVLRGFALLGILLLNVTAFGLPNAAFSDPTVAGGASGVNFAWWFVSQVHGFGLFARLQRAELLLVVLPIWMAQLLWSPLWLRRFRFGPMEWVWRSLVYWRPQPMRLAAARPPAPLPAAAAPRVPSSGR